MKKKKGFSLLELLVVILIIGILAAIALSHYRLAVAKSRFETLKNLTHEIVNSQYRYYIIHDEYAEKVTDLDMDFPVGEISDDEKKITFDWGECHIYSRTYNKARDNYCHHNAGVTYGIYIGNERASDDGKGCNTSCDNKLYNYICKQISQRESPSYTSGDDKKICYYRY